MPYIVKGCKHLYTYMGYFCVFREFCGTYRSEYEEICKKNQCNPCNPCEIIRKKLYILADFSHK